MQVPEGWDLERWVDVATMLAQAEDRSAVLSAHGLDEDGWAAIDAAFDAQISAAIHEDTGEDELAPPLLERLGKAQAAAQARNATAAPLSFEAFVQVTRAIVASGDPVRIFEETRITPMTFAQANMHWAKVMSTNPALAERFAAEIAKPR
ncbi:MAG: hypothetical protein JNL79_25015 [Myxococcales bacterium]|nr:hypothetical protein [Myxococcales bacterium]